MKGKIIMGYAIMRIQKVKAAATFAAIERHDRERYRLKHRKNPDKAFENKWIQNKYHEKEKSLVERFNALTDGIKYRKDAVLGFEIVCAYSPEEAVFIPQKEWIKENLNWVSDTFGTRNVIGAFYHVDETTPHLHFVVVPLVEGKLKAKYYTGGKAALSHLQDTYAERMKVFNLKRGNRYLDNPEIPSANHTSLKEYWRDVEEKERLEMEKIKEEVFGKEK